MKNDLSSIELRQIVSEAQSIIGARLDKAVQKGRELLLQFYLTGRGNFTIRILPGKFFYLTAQKAIGGEELNFIMRLRKYLPMTFLRGVVQLGSERIVKLELESKDRKFRLYTELFGKGNVILCDEDDKVIAVMEKDMLKPGSKPGETKYEPQIRGADVFDPSEEKLARIKDSSQSSLVKALAIELGIGGVYAEELCSISGIDKKMRPDELTGSGIKKLFDSIKEILSRKPEPMLICKGSEMINAVPFRLEIYKDNESKKTATYNEALDTALSSRMLDEKKELAKVGMDKKLARIQRIIDEQGKALAAAQREMKENTQKGEKLYENYAAVKEVLDELNKAQKKLSWKEIKDRLKGHKVIKSVNEKEKKVVIEL